MLDNQLSMYLIHFYINIFVAHHTKGRYTVVEIVVEVRSTPNNTKTTTERRVCNHKYSLFSSQGTLD